MSDPETITRRSLPHWYRPGAATFVTYRLAGTVPPELMGRWRARNETELAQAAPAAARAKAHKQFFARMDGYLDEGRGRTWLAQPGVAALIRRSLHFHHGKRYHLIAYCVMPNHVHVLFQPRETEGGAAPAGQSPLARIMHSLKSYTAKEANPLLGRTGAFWQDGSYDHWVRDEDELGRIIDYIAQNPVYAGLVARPHEWHWSSAHDRYLADGSECGWLSDALEVNDLG
ncbi:MAG: REP-associated tyrosine transposase [Gemmataceae bacterium]